MLIYAIAHGDVRIFYLESLHWKLTQGEKSLAELGNRTCVGGVLVRRSTNVFTEIGKFGYQRGKIKRFVVVVYNQMLRLKQKSKKKSDIRKRFPQSRGRCRYPRSTVGWQRLPSCPSIQSMKAHFNIGQRPCGKVQSFEGKFNAQILYLDTTNYVWWKQRKKATTKNLDEPQWFLDISGVNNLGHFFFLFFFFLHRGVWRKKEQVATNLYRARIISCATEFSFKHNAIDSFDSRSTFPATLYWVGTTRTKRRANHNLWQAYLITAVLRALRGPFRNHNGQVRTKSVFMCAIISIYQS